MNRWFLCSVCVLAMTSDRALAEWPRMTAKPRTSPGLPPYRYVATSEQPKPLVTGTSLPRLTMGEERDPLNAVVPNDGFLISPKIATREQTTTSTVTTLFSSRTKARVDGVTVVTPTLLTRPKETTLPTGVATFQLLDQVLKVDHCSVSQVSVAFYADGRYAIRFRADQNPLASDPFLPSLQAATKSANTNLDPNQFKRNKFYLTIRGFSGNPLNEAGITATKAALVELPIDAFMVERGQPVTGFVEGTSDNVRRNYKLIDRVEVDFTYR